jgi:hypothetical protein
MPIGEAKSPLDVRAGFRKWVTDGIRTRDPRDHNPVLYQLSYDHHAHLAVPHHHSGISDGAVERVTRRVRPA